MAWRRGAGKAARFRRGHRGQHSGGFAQAIRTDMERIRKLARDANIKVA
jgi:hypothetical protein